MSTREIDTPHGPARAHLQAVKDPPAMLFLGHGAGGGGVAARDLVKTAETAHHLGLTVVLVEQPYLVAGRRSPAPAKHLDAAWTAVVQALGCDGPVVAGGRSAGARVACRTAEATGAVAVLCLAFPEHPPGRPEKSRQAELDAVSVPTLVVQGDSDPFGMPAAGPSRQVVTVPGNHSLRSDLDAVATAVREWLPGVIA